MGLLDNVPRPFREVLKYTSPITSFILDEETREEAKETFDSGVRIAKDGVEKARQGLDDVTDKLIPNKAFLKKQINTMKQSEEKYGRLVEAVQKKASELHKVRMVSGRRLIKRVEKYINTLANTPKKLNTAVGQYQVAYKQFDKSVHKLDKAAQNQNDNILLGTALLTLSGAGGFGIASLVLGYRMNKKCLEDANEAVKITKKIETHRAKLKIVKAKIVEHVKLTRQHIKGTNDILSSLKNSAPDNYSNFSKEQKYELGSLVNHITSLSGLLNQKIRT